MVTQGGRHRNRRWLTVTNVRLPSLSYDTLTTGGPLENLAFKPCFDEWAFGAAASYRKP